MNRVTNECLSIPFALPHTLLLHLAIMCTNQPELAYKSANSGLSVKCRHTEQTAKTRGLFQDNFLAPRLSSCIHFCSSNKLLVDSQRLCCCLPIVALSELLVQYAKLAHFRCPLLPSRAASRPAQMEPLLSSSTEVNHPNSAGLSAQKGGSGSILSRCRMLRQSILPRLKLGCEQSFSCPVGCLVGNGLAVRW